METQKVKYVKLSGLTFKDGLWFGLGFAVASILLKLVFGILMSAVMGFFSMMPPTMPL
jgi:hypothetical protein